MENTEFVVGERVKFTESYYGCLDGKYKTAAMAKKGTILGFVRSWNGVLVLWDNRKSPQGYSPKHLEKLPPPCKHLNTSWDEFTRIATCNDCGQVLN